MVRAKTVPILPIRSNPIATKIIPLHFCPQGQGLPAANQLDNTSSGLVKSPAITAAFFELLFVLSINYQYIQILKLHHRAGLEIQPMSTRVYAHILVDLFHQDDS